MYEGVTMRLLCVLITALFTVNADPDANVHLAEIASARLPQRTPGDTAHRSFATGGHHTTHALFVTEPGERAVLSTLPERAELRRRSRTLKQVCLRCASRSTPLDGPLLQVTEPLGSPLASDDSDVPSPNGDQRFLHRI